MSQSDLLCVIMLRSHSKLHIPSLSWCFESLILPNLLLRLLARYMSTKSNSPSKKCLYVISPLSMGLFCSSGMMILEWVSKDNLLSKKYPPSEKSEPVTLHASWTTWTILIIISCIL